MPGVGGSSPLIRPIFTTFNLESGQTFYGELFPSQMIFIRNIIFIIPIFILVSCSVPEQIPGKPWHHTTEGFRNPPGSPKKNNWLSRVPWLIGKPFERIIW